MSLRLNLMLAAGFAVAVSAAGVSAAEGPEATVPSIELARAPAERASSVSGARPVLTLPTPMKVLAGQTAEQELRASDADGDPLAFTMNAGPAFMTVLTIDPGSGEATGRIHLAPGPADIGVWSGSVRVTDGTLATSGSVSIVVGNNRPLLTTPLDVEMESGRSVDQILEATDVDGDALTFYVVRGPDFVRVETTGPTTGRMTLAPTAMDGGEHEVVVAASDGLLAHEGAFQVFVRYVDRFQPILAQPEDMVVTAGTGANQEVTATDPDGEPLTFTRGSGAPRYIWVSTVDLGRGTARANISVVPALSDAPPTPDPAVVVTTATVHVTDGTLSDQKSFTVTASFPADRPPVLDLPTELTFPEKSLRYYPITAHDPDGDALTFGPVDPPPFVRLFGPHYLEFNPTYTDAGAYTILVRVTDARGLSDEGTIPLTITDVNAPPELERVPPMLTFPGRVLEQELHASDIDGNPLFFSKQSGPSFMTVTTRDPGAGSATGVVRLEPGASDIGNTGGTFLVSDGIVTSTGFVRIEVHPLEVPALMKIDDLCTHPDATLSIRVLAIDPEGDRLTFSQSGLPAYASLVDNGDNTAVLEVRPPATEPFGSSFVAITVTDGTHSDTQIFAVSLTRQGLCPGEWIRCTWCQSTGLHDNRFPIPAAGGPYAGVAGRAVSFDGRQSHDPDGEPVRLAWDFGEGEIGMGPTPSHTYRKGGLYSVILIATDGVATSRASTTATIADALPARVYAPEGQRKLLLNAAKPTLCAGIEPVDGSFDIRDADLSSIVLELSLGDPGSPAAEIPSYVPKTRVVEDRDENGIEEIEACFNADDIRGLFAGSVSGTSSVTASVEGRLLSGGRFSGPIDLEIVSKAGSGHAVVSPNPLNPVGVLTFSTSRTGPVRVSIYDPSGRLVRVQYRAPADPAGERSVTLDGRASNGQALGSGVYFYRLETVDGTSTGRFLVLK